MTATKDAPGGVTPTQPRGEPTPVLKHVIAESRYRTQTVTCVCGWHGSTSSVDGRTSDWSRHVAEFRPKR